MRPPSHAGNTGLNPAQSGASGTGGVSFNVFLLAGETVKLCLKMSLFGSNLIFENPGQCFSTVLAQRIRT